MKRDISLSLTIARNAQRSAAFVEILFNSGKFWKADSEDVYA